MLRNPLAPAACLSLLLGSVAAAQIVPPAPPAAEKTPPYQAPEPASHPVVQPPPRPDPAPDAPLPSLVKRDAGGNLIPIEGSVELAAVLALDLDDQTRANIRKQVSIHDAEMDQRVRDNLALALEIHRAREALSGDSPSADLAQLQELAKSLKPLRPGVLLDRLMTTNTITARQRQQAELVLREYSTASTENLTKQSGNDVQKTISLSLRRAFVDLSGDADRSLVRQAAAAAAQLAPLLDSAGLSADQRAAIKPKLQALAKANAAGDAPAASRLAIDICLTDLTPEQLGAVLGAMAPEGAAKP
ncbi:MAG: hypothetical protein KF745_09590 [Phycisphaeraceae bacterium]|nr:hypothetical protein [Phycisphaeraceae bacterium]